MRRLILLLLISVFLFGCNHGLAPEPVTNAKPGFGGTVRFISQWPHPPQDSVYDLRVVAFHDYPPQNIIYEVSSGGAVVYPSISSPAPQLFVDSLQYNFTLDSAATFGYIAVVMQDGPNILSDWKVVGAYGYSQGVGAPESVTVPSNKYVSGVDIEVDFKNLPPNPLDTASTPASK